MYIRTVQNDRDGAMLIIIPFARDIEINPYRVTRKPYR